VIDERSGRNGRLYAIRYSIALPGQWNGRFLFQGGAGFNGTVRPPVGWEAVGRELALSRGFAVVSTDSGHTGAVFDGTFFEDQDATVNFLYRVDKVTVVAKQIIAIHYGRAPERSYFVGIVVGAPAMRTSYSGIGDRWLALALNGIAPRDEAGRPIAARAFSEGEELADRRPGLGQYRAV